MFHVKPIIELESESKKGKIKIMGYPNFGKVKTITLPIPERTMSFAEYKNAFGIDLEELENTELLLLKEPDGQIVPVLYYDKENAVLYTANYSVDISAGFEVETESLISKVIEGGTIENAKPVYWHSVKFIRQGANYYYFDGFAIILSNDETPIDKDAFIDLLKTAGFYLIVQNGEYEMTSSATKPTASSVPLVALKALDGEYFELTYRDANKELQVENVYIRPEQWTISDLGANKLN